jgi:hypothetical protein
MKSLKVFLGSMLFVSLSYAGTEVPWPITSQEAVRISDLTGTWVSSNLKEPGYLYFFSVSLTTSYIPGQCPYLLSVEEMSPFEQITISKGWSTVCQINQNAITFKLYDSKGRPHGRLEIVGVRKDENEGGIGGQYLGVMIYNGMPRPQLEAADTFFKYSNQTEPVWPL